MSRQQDFDQVIADMDEATNDIAADYEKLLGEIANNSVSAETLTKARAGVARLKTLGASVDNPVPEPPTT